MSGFNFNAHRKATLADSERYPVIPRLECADGFYVSVQASRGHYCEPRDNVGPWTHVECGFPSEACEVLMPYAENPEAPTDTVYDRVPVTLVEGLIDAHGGLKP